MKLKTGDIFKIPISEVSNAIGQIISTAQKGSLTVIIFEGLYNVNSIIDPEEVTKERVLFFANTFDAKFYHKHWPTTVNYISNIRNICLPVYKLGIEDSLRYEDFFMKSLTEEVLAIIQKSKVGYRSYVAPIRVENAVKAYYKLADWMDEYDGLLYENLVVCAKCG